jgi:UPF0755 protein
LNGNAKPGLLAKAGLLLLSLAAAFGAWNIYDVFWGGNTFATNNPKTFHVSRGQSFAEVTDLLETSGIIRSRPLFIFVAKVFGGTDRIRVGKYEFPSGISNLDIFLSMREGRRTVPIPVTLREGLRANRFAAILAGMGGIDSTRYMELVRSERFARSLGIGRSSLEGYLLPETYSFQWQQSEESIIREQVQQFWKAFDESLRTRAGEIGWSLHDVVTLASIIEGEVVLGSERARVSGVYHNRLQKGMLLQADPTVQFFVENGPRRLLYSDLRTDHPYNTYLRRGLPPGPVNNPGRESLFAALYPEKHAYLYFVANGAGGHWFSSSYSEHQKNVQKFRKNRRAKTALQKAAPAKQSASE